VPKIQFPIESVQGNLYFDPLDAFVEPGREFEISVALNNRTGRSADGFDFTVAYDPRWLEFLSCDASILTPYVGPGSWVEMAPYAAEAEEPPVDPALAPAPGPEKGSGRRLHFTRSRGRLMFSAEFARPLTGERTRLITLRFRAAEGAGITSLRFLHPPERVAAVFSSGDNILGNNERSLRGLLNANLFIESLTRPAAAGGTTTRTMGRVVDLDTVMPSELEPEARALSGWSRAPSDAQLEARVAIHLQPPERVSFHVGDTFWVDLVLINDSGAPISSIGATVAFDPAVLEVIDEDKDNWILEGTNVWDGGFHETYPFDFHWANSADNERGIIAYRAGRYNRPWTFPTGVFARIHFRALASCETTSVRLERSTEGARPQTYLRSFGIDRLDKTWNPRNPPRVDLRIAPAPIASANGTAS
jgi:hypothetical protein